MDGVISLYSRLMSVQCMYLAMHISSIFSISRPGVKATNCSISLSDTYQPHKRETIQERDREREWTQQTTSPGLPTTTQPPTQPTSRAQTHPSTTRPPTHTALQAWQTRALEQPHMVTQIYQASAAPIPIHTAGVAQPQELHMATMPTRREARDTTRSSMEL